MEINLYGKKLITVNFKLETIAGDGTEFHRYLKQEICSITARLADYGNHYKIRCNVWLVKSDNLELDNDKLDIF